MKRLIVGYSLGAGTVLLIVIGCMLDGSPFTSMLLKCGIENGRGIVFTERFAVVYEGMKGNDANAANITYAGKHGTLPAFWSGYGQGWSGGSEGIENLHTYEPGSGTATLFFHGKLLRVEEDGQYIRVQDKRLPLGKERVVVIVAEDALCHPLVGPEADALLQSIPVWYKDPEMNARPAVTSAMASR